MCKKPWSKLHERVEAALANVVQAIGVGQTLGAIEARGGRCGKPWRIAASRQTGWGASCRTGARTTWGGCTRFL